MINGRKKLAYFCALSVCATLVSCAKKDADKVGEAQLCLDDATQGTAAACMEKIAGVETSGAYALRCSANFIDEGFTQPARFKQAFDAFDTNSSNNTEAFMSVITFKSKADIDANLAFANQTFEYCNKSGAKGLMLLGTMASTSTTLAKVADTLAGSGTQPTAEQINDALESLTGGGGDPATIAAIGTVVSATYESSCGNGSTNQSICDQLNEALVGVDTTDPAAVGAAVIAKWAEPPAP